MHGRAAKCSNYSKVDLAAIIKMPCELMLPLE